MESESFLTSVRLTVMTAARDTGQIPDADQVARLLGATTQDVTAAFRHLHDAHAAVLEPGDPTRLRMANPFSAVPTNFRVFIGQQSWWGNCIWDGLGIIAALGGTGTLATTCPDCGEPGAVHVGGHELQDGAGIAYIGVPAHKWWDDIIYT